MAERKSTSTAAATGLLKRRGVAPTIRAFIEGAVVVMPIGAIVLLIIGIVRRLKDAADPLSGRFIHPVIVAVLMLVLLCVLVGFLVRSSGGSRVRGLLDRWIFERVPGYRLAKAFANDQFAEGSDGKALRPALAAIEEGQCPAIVMDEFADGRLLVFVPGSPAPMSGALYIFTPDRIMFVDVPLVTFVKAISSWGLGLREMLEAADGAHLSPPP